MTTRCAQPLLAECILLLSVFCCCAHKQASGLSILGGACVISHQADRTICKTMDAILAINYHAYLRWGCRTVIDC